MLWITLQLGVRNLMLHKLRSFLTMLGTILGVGSVIAMLAIGEGSKRKAVEQIRQLGATNVIIRSIKPEPENDNESTGNSASQRQNSRVLEYGLKYRDFERLRDTIPTVTRALPIAVLRKDAHHGHRRISNAQDSGYHAALPVRQESPGVPGQVSYRYRPASYGQRVCPRGWGSPAPLWL